MANVEGSTNNPENRPYRYEPYLVGPLTACRVHPCSGGSYNSRDEAECRKGRLLGRLLGSSDYFSESYPYVNGTDTVYIDEFLRFVNEPEDVLSNRKNPYRIYGRRLEGMKKIAKRGLLPLVRRLVFTGVTVRVDPIPETRLGEEEFLVGQGDMSQVLDHNDLSSGGVAKHFKIEREHFVDLTRHDVYKLVKLMYTGGIIATDPSDILERCELIGESRHRYSLNGATLSFVSYIHSDSGDYNWFYILHEGTLYDDLISVINELLTEYEKFVPLIAIELGRTNPTNNLVPYYTLDGDVYIENFLVFLGGREDWRVYLPVPYAKKNVDDFLEENWAANDHPSDWYRQLRDNILKEDEEAEEDTDETRPITVIETPDVRISSTSLSAHVKYMDVTGKEKETKDPLTDEMHLFAIFWYLKTLCEPSEYCESFGKLVSRYESFDKLVSRYRCGLINANPYVMSAPLVWTTVFGIE